MLDLFGYRLILSNLCVVEGEVVTPIRLPGRGIVIQRKRRAMVPDPRPVMIDTVAMGKAILIHPVFFEDLKRQIDAQR